jgi:hypothetical protein
MQPWLSCQRNNPVENCNAAVDTAGAGDAGRGGARLIGIAWRE